MKSKNKKRNKNQKNNINRELLGVIVLSFGLLSLISLFSNKTGVVGAILKNMYLTLMGFAGYIFPLIIIFIGISFIINKDSLDNDKKSIYLLLIFLCFIIILDIKFLKIETFSKK